MLIRSFVSADEGVLWSLCPEGAEGGKVYYTQKLTDGSESGQGVSPETRVILCTV